MNRETKLKVVRPLSDQEAASEIEVTDLNVWFRDRHILNGLNVRFKTRKINCIVGPSGAGKSTLIRSINRINDGIEGICVRGSIVFNGRNIIDKSEDITRLRTQIGMVFQKPCVFPKSISENVLFGIERQKKISSSQRMQIVEDSLMSVSLWKEISHRLNDKAGSLSIGQQQRLCIARTLAVKPKVILLDEPTSSLDPVSTYAIESLMVELKNNYTIIFVTHNLQQARRIADHLVFMCDGKIIEQGSKDKLFANPEKEQTRTYLNNEYCKC